MMRYVLCIMHYVLCIMNYPYIAFGKTPALTIKNIKNKA
jgi:hypothetical protein